MACHRVGRPGRGAIVRVVLSVVASVIVLVGALALAPVPRADGSDRRAAVNPAASDLTAGPPTPKNPTIDPGQYVVLTSAASGGTEPYFYQWMTGDFSQCASDTAISGATLVTLNITPSLNGYYCYQVTDSTTPTAEEADSSTIFVQVNNTLLAEAPTPASATIDYGDAVTVSAHPSAGTPPYSYQWYVGTSPMCTANSLISGAVGSTYSADPTETASFCYVLSDSSAGSPRAYNGSVASVVTVNPQLVPGPVSPSLPTIDAGQSLTLSADPGGGTPPYHYQWHAGTSGTCSADSAVSGGTAESLTVEPTTSTYYCYGLSDASTSSPTILSGTDWVNVRPALQATSIAPINPGLDPGQTITLDANPTGGIAPYTIDWYVGTYPDCSSDDASPIAGTTNLTSYSFAPAGSGYYCYGVTDSASPAVTQLSPTDLVELNGTPLAGAPTPNSPTIDAGQSVNLTGHPSGGIPPYHVQWYTGEVGGQCAAGAEVGGANSLTVSVAPISGAWYCYVLSDSSVGSPIYVYGSDSDAIVVNPPLLAKAVTSSSSTGGSGGPMILSAHPTGGTPVYQLQWRAGPSSDCNSDSPISSATAGNLSVHPSSTTYYCYQLTDGSYNPPTVYSPTFEIYIPSSNPAVPWLYIGVGAAAGAGLLAAVLFVRHRRRRAEPVASPTEEL